MSTQTTAAQSEPGEASGSRNGESLRDGSTPFISILFLIPKPERVFLGSTVALWTSWFLRLAQRRNPKAKGGIEFFGRQNSTSGIFATGADFDNYEQHLLSSDAGKISFLTSKAAFSNLA